jgi:hypothetical protein
MLVFHEEDLAQHVLFGILNKIEKSELSQDDTDPSFCVLAPKILPFPK